MRIKSKQSREEKWEYPQKMQSQNAGMWAVKRSMMLDSKVAHQTIK